MGRVGIGGEGRTRLIKMPSEESRRGQAGEEGAAGNEAFSSVVANDINLIR